jgi:hypothetical protein
MCRNNFMKPILVRVCNWNRFSENSVIGEFQCTLGDIAVPASRSRRFEVVNHARLAAANQGKYFNSGALIFTSARVFADKSYGVERGGAGGGHFPSSLGASAAASASAAAVSAARATAVSQAEAVTVLDDSNLEDPEEHL